MSIEDSVITHGDPVKQFSLMLENRIGALHSMMKLLNDFNVHTLGFSVQDSFDVTILRLIASDPEATETLFIERGISYAVNEIVVVLLREGATSLGSCFSILSSAETNIHLSYPLFVSHEDRALLALSVEDPEFASMALQNGGFKLLFQNDLSR